MESDRTPPCYAPACTFPKRKEAFMWHLGASSFDNSIVAVSDAANILRAIHRWDGYTVLCRKTTTWQQEGTPVWGLTTELLSPYVGATDCYFTINTMISKRRKATEAKNLTAVWV